MTRNAETEITGKGSRTRIFVIPTDEELVMTEDSYALLAGVYDVHTRYTYTFQHQAYVNKERQAAFLAEIDKTPEIEKLAVYAR